MAGTLLRAVSEMTVPLMNLHEGVGHEYKAGFPVPKRSYHRFDFTVAADTGRDGLYRQQSGGGFERFQEIWLHHRALCRGRAEKIVFGVG